MPRKEKETEGQVFKNFQNELLELKTPWVKDKIQIFAFLSAFLTFFAVLASYLYLVSTGYFNKVEPPVQTANMVPSYEMKHVYALRDSLDAKKNRLNAKADSLQHEIISKEFILKILNERSEKLLIENSLMSINFLLSNDSKNIILQNKYITEISTLINRYDEIIRRAGQTETVHYDLDAYHEHYQASKNKILTALAGYRKTKDRSQLLEINSLIPVLDKFILPIEMDLLEFDINQDKIKKEISLSQPDSI